MKKITLVSIFTSLMLVSSLSANELQKEEDKNNTFKKSLDDYNNGDKSSQTLFLLGMTSKQMGKLEESEKYFTEFLAKEPDTPRVKLELSEVYYTMGKFDEATKLLQEVKSTNPPAVVGNNIDNFMAMIKKNRPKAWSGYAKMGLVHDSNVNQGPSTDNILMYNLPFKLSDDAKDNSDWGLSLQAGANHNYVINPNTAWQSSLNLGLMKYQDIKNYDSVSLSASTGPSHKNGAWYLSLPLIANGVKIGHEDRYYSASIGLAPQVAYQLNQKVSLSSSLALSDKHYHNNSDRDSQSITFSPSMRYIIDNGSYLSFGGYAGRESSDMQTAANNSKGLNATYAKALAPNTTLYLSPSWSNTNYDGTEIAFGKSRDDDYRSMGATLNYDIPSWESTASLSLNWAKNSSSIDMYDFKRVQTMLSLSKNF